jgi:hypothetical protein
LIEYISNLHSHIRDAILNDQMSLG